MADGIDVDPDTVDIFVDDVYDGFSCSATTSAATPTSQTFDTRTADSQKGESTRW